MVISRVITRRMVSSARAGAVAAGIALASPGHASAQVNCSTEPLAVQVLGSGGPYAGGTRASTGYLVWRNGRAVVTVDAGGGTFLRFGEAGARLQDLSLLAISHVHPDHVSDVPALLWLSEQARQQPLKVAGPSGAGAFPSVETFMTRLFDAGSGVFPALGGTLRQSGAGVRLDVVTVDAAAGVPATIWSDDDLEVRAVGVPHGNTPSLAYRIRIGDRTVVFGSDQNGSDPRFSSFAADAESYAGVVQSVRSRPNRGRGAEVVRRADRHGGRSAVHSNSVGGLRPHARPRERKDKPDGCRPGRHLPSVRAPWPVDGTADVLVSFS